MVAAVVVAAVSGFIVPMYSPLLVVLGLPLKCLETAIAVVTRISILPADSVEVVSQLMRLPTVLHSKHFPGTPLSKPHSFVYMPSISILALLAFSNLGLSRDGLPICLLQLGLSQNEPRLVF